MISKKYKRVTATLAVTMAVGFAPSTAYASTINNYEKRIEMNQDKLDNLEEERAETKFVIEGLNEEINNLIAEMNELTRKISDSNAQIEKLSEELAVLENEIEILDNEIFLLRSAIKLTKDKIEEKEIELDENQKYLETRVREAYKSNPFSQVIVSLISSKSLSEFYDRLNFINIMAEEDRKIIKEINEMVTELDIEKEKLEAQNESLEIKLSELSAKRVETERVMKKVTMEKENLENKMNQVESLESKKRITYSNLSQKEKEIAQEIGDIQTENEALENEIQKIILEEQRKAEERRRKEEEARAKAEAEAGRPQVPATSNSNQSSGYLRPVSGRITSPFGYRIHPIWKVQRFHNGIDFAGGTGTPVKSTRSGTVILSQYKPSYGNLVIVDHGNGITSLYAHLNSFSVSAGQRVEQGQTVGGVGSTGDSTGPHLHFEIRVNGQPKNPADYLN